MADKIKQALEAQIGAIQNDQVVKYQLPEYRGGGIAWVALNNTGKGKKYILYNEKTEGGKPTGKKVVANEFKDVKEAAGWVKDCGGVLISDASGVTVKEKAPVK